MNFNESFIAELDYNTRFNLLWDLVQEKVPFILYGPAGTGKSFIGYKIMEKYIADVIGKDPKETLFKLNEISDEDIESDKIYGIYIAGSANITRFDLLGGRTLIGGSYRRSPGLIMKMMKRGGIVFIDELSSLPPNFVILLNELIDRVINRQTHPNFFIFFAANPNYYKGTEPLPESTLERIVLIPFPYYPKNVEENIVLELLKKRGITLPNIEIFVRYIVGLMRFIRAKVSETGINFPISPRSMYWVALQSIKLSKYLSFRTSISDYRLLEHIFIILNEREPISRQEIYSDLDVSKLIEFLNKNKISWDSIRNAITMLGIMASLRDEQVSELIVNILPRLGDTVSRGDRILPPI